MTTDAGRNTKDEQDGAAGGERLTAELEPAPTLEFVETEGPWAYELFDDCVLRF